ncbi:MAG TPA: hypothetical protein H9870_13910 [Candidatus Corynebacterium avicola]|uniref:Uncharacterized protein n=1 Tax=Candidatus Corynebacterium avicola TaxID=2838527 RepID=A0A9D1ULW1_9CORY|nr:hypothetical protein [Candidatus Corynebacterium avicola]
MWGTPAPEHQQRPSAQPFPPTDPYGRYRPAATGRHRTARWFILVGIAVLVLVAPLAVPLKDFSEVEDTYRPSEMVTMSMLPSEQWPLDLTGLDRDCAATDVGVVTFSMSCWMAAIGDVEVHIGGFTGIGDSDEDVELAAQRGMRTATLTDTSDAVFTRQSDVPASPSLTPEVDEALVSEPHPVSGLGLTPPDVMQDDSPVGQRETQPVSVRGGVQGSQQGDVEPAQNSQQVYAATVALLNRDADGESAMYTVTVISDYRPQVEDMARFITGSIRAA